MNGAAAAFSSLWWRGVRYLPPQHYHHRDDGIAQWPIDAAAAEPEAILKQLGMTSAGLTVEAAAQRLSALGPNLVAHERRQSLVQELVGRAKNPLNLLLLSLDRLITLHTAQNQADLLRHSPPSPSHDPVSRTSPRRRESYEMN